MDAADDQLLLDDAPVQDPEVLPGAGQGGAQNPPRRASFLTKAFTELACDRSQVTNELTAFQVRLPGFLLLHAFQETVDRAPDIFKFSGIDVRELQMYLISDKTAKSYPERLF